jgi:hypothetical protein
MCVNIATSGGNRVVPLNACTIARGRLHLTLKGYHYNLGHIKGKKRYTRIFAILTAIHVTWLFDAGKLFILITHFVDGSNVVLTIGIVIGVVAEIVIAIIISSVFIAGTKRLKASLLSKKACLDAVKRV